MKKIIGLLLLLFSATFMINNVLAKEITLESLATEINNNQDEFDLNAEVREGTLVITSEEYDSKIDVVKFANNSGLLTHEVVYDANSEAEDIFGTVILTAFAYGEILDALANLHGYTEIEKVWFKKDITEATLAEDGYEYLEIEEETKTIFKVDINKFNLKVNYIDAPAPIINIGKVESDAIHIKASANVADDTDIYFYISEDGENYELMLSTSVTDGETMSFSYGDFKPNTKYYFKAAVYQSKNFSEVVSATTLKEGEEPKAEVGKQPTNNQTNNTNTNSGSNNTTGKDQTISNPKTGIMLPVGGFVVILGLMCIISKFTKRKLYKI